MDITPIVGILLPLLQKGAEKIAESIGEDTWKRIKTTLTLGKDKDHSLLERLKNPGDHEAVVLAKEKLEQLLRTHPELQTELANKLQISRNETNSTSINISASNSTILYQSHGNTIRDQNSK